MVVLNRIYTRTGDDGSTGLSTGERRKKYDLRVSAYGTVDETNSCVGIAREIPGIEPHIAAMLMRIQHDLFDLGADLATPEGVEKPSWEPLRITAGQVTRLEAEIDELNGHLQPLRSFVLPGGSQASAALHLARTVARRAERLIVELAAIDGEIVSAEAVQYINRLSDFLFVASRSVNDNGARDVLWVPGKNR
jgi:cob(I)alamin adenosyltransferase